MLAYVNYISFSLRGLDDITTVEPRLSGHTRGNGKWPLIRGLIGVGRLNGVSSEISIRGGLRGINVTLSEYNTLEGL